MHRFVWLAEASLWHRARKAAKLATLAGGQGDIEPRVNERSWVYLSNDFAYASAHVLITIPLSAHRI